MSKKYLNICSKSVSITLLLLLVIACSHQQIDVPVSNRTHLRIVSQGWHVVKPGETLFSIAWLYGKDYRELAGANKIGSPYLIHPDQKLSLSAHIVPSGLSSVPSILTTKKQLAKPRSDKVYRKSTSPITKKKLESLQVLRWRWPANGRVLSHFSAQGRMNKGIDIAGNIGEPVIATAAGEVVYAGSGLKGYGNLIIVKHNDSYLSAYAHNKALFVKEGGVVKASQKIAEIGSTGTSEPKLHFEIRRNGKPVDPLLYLSKR
ncbi:MAG: peptidoglycan DD-metalloendopeptidase family protein [Endozoicomonadaceae bacterium]|nr:peptidoglycan DD-metalloendopeptidase family protein [Endozoicomonadaceae bacterium]